MYKDRLHAGRVLGDAALEFEAEDPLVLAIPRGGVVVGREVAARIGAPLDVVMAKKIGAPFNPEFAIAAVDPDGEILFSPDVSWAGLREYVLEQAEGKRQELRENLMRFRSGRTEKPIKGRTVFLVDDGLATGLTAMAALRYIRRHDPKSIILAVPVAPQDSIQNVGAWADKVICPLKPRHFYAVGEWYDSFEQVDDQEVIDVLEEFADLQ